MTDFFLDFSAANDGDGTSAAQAGSPGVTGAWNNLTNLRIQLSIAAGDKVWIRRVSFQNWGASQLQFGIGMGLVPVGYKYYIGWPIVGDADYAGRPASGVSTGWDSDSQLYAEIHSSDTSALPFDGFGGALRRLKLFHTISGNGSISSTLVRAYDMRHCYVTSNISGNPNYALVRGNNQTYNRGGTNVTVGAYYSDTVFECKSVAKNIICIDACDFLDCTFQRITPFDSNTSVAILGEGNFSRCTFIDASAGNSPPTVTISDGGVTLPAGYAGPTLTSCVIDNSAATVNVNWALQVNMRATIRNLTVRGTGVLHQAASCPPIHITNFAQSLVGTAGIKTLVPCFLRVDNAVFKANTTSDVILGDENVLALVNASFVSGTSLTRVTSTGVKFAVYSLNEGGVVNAWRYIGATGTITRNNSVARTGGEVFSLKMFQNEILGAYYAALETGGFPGFETIFVPISPGSNTITVYGAVRSFDATLFAVDQDTVWFEVDYLDGTSGHRVTASTKQQGALVSDGSTWTGDGSLTPFKLSTIITATQGHVAPLRIYYNKPSPGSNAAYYTYLDPKAVVS